MEIFEKLIKINRCVTVNKGGRKFSFSAIVVVGDKKGLCGYGFGKGNEISEAKFKATYQAKKNMFRIFLKDRRTIFHNSIGKFCSSTVLIRPAFSGNGIIAGGSIRSLFEVLGIKDIIAKSIGSNNPHNLSKAAINALKKINLS